MLFHDFNSEDYRRDRWSYTRHNMIRTWYTINKFNYGWLRSSEVNDSPYGSRTMTDRIRRKTSVTRQSGARINQLC